ncbi:MAG: hypothetical protein AAGA54_18950 [Myxococcota bacterium]
MRVSLCLALSLLSGCFLFGRSGGGGPCADDALDCRDGDALQVDEVCEDETALLLELGDGDGRFRPLAPGEPPEEIQGAQGGSHMVLGVGIDNPRESHLAFEVNVVLTQGEGEEAFMPGDRTAVYDADLVEFDQGRAELLNFVLIPDGWFAGEPRQIDVTVRDACGRTGTLTHTIEP